MKGRRDRKTEVWNSVGGTISAWRWSKLHLKNKGGGEKRQGGAAGAARVANTNTGVMQKHGSIAIYATPG